MVRNKNNKQCFFTASSQEYLKFHMWRKNEDENEVYRYTLYVTWYGLCIRHTLLGIKCVWYVGELHGIVCYYSRTVNCEIFISEE